jgi:putative sugar O-methyltransferase
MCRLCDSNQGHHHLTINKFKMDLLEQLLKDEKKIDKELYSSGSYWSYKNSKSLIELRLKGMSDFRGNNNGTGTSYTDNLTYDIRNELGRKGRIVAKLLSLPFLKRIFNAQLKQTKQYLDKYIKTLSILYSNSERVKNLINKYKFENTTDFDCTMKFNYKKKDYSFLYLEVANRIEILSSNFDFHNLKSFFEIGGGFGANIHFLITNFPNIKKIIYLDTVPNLYVGTEYLKNYYGTKVTTHLNTRELTEIKFANNDDLEIICIPPWQIEKLQVSIDHFHNASSFVEMPKKIIKNYYKFIKKFNTKEISLVSYAEHDAKTLNPNTLNEFFENRLTGSSHDGLIKGHKSKDIYFCSKKS